MQCTCHLWVPSRYELSQSKYSNNNHILYHRHNDWFEAYPYSTHTRTYRHPISIREFANGFMFRHFSLFSLLFAYLCTGDVKQTVHFWLVQIIRIPFSLFQKLWHFGTWMILHTLYVYQWSNFHYLTNNEVFVLSHTWMHKSCSDGNKNLISQLDPKSQITIAHMDKTFF